MPQVPALAQKWAAEPFYRVSYDQLTAGAEDASTAGSLIGDYQGVRDAVKDGLLSMLTGGLSSDAALQKAQREAGTAIKAPNDRLGVGSRKALPARSRAPSGRHESRHVGYIGSCRTKESGRRMSPDSSSQKSNAALSQRGAGHSIGVFQ
jgi:hypothetical protein